MIEWFLDLTPLYRILMVAVIGFFLFLIFPGVKINLRNIVKAIVLIVAALLLYSIYSGQSPDTLFQRATQPSAEREAPVSVPKYYEDPEKRWQKNR